MSTNSMDELRHKFHWDSIISKVFVVFGISIFFSVFVVGAMALVLHDSNSRHEESRVDRVRIHVREEEIWTQVVKNSERLEYNIRETTELKRLYKRVDDLENFRKSIEDMWRRKGEEKK